MRLFLSFCRQKVSVSFTRPSFILLSLFSCGTTLADWRSRLAPSSTVLSQLHVRCAELCFYEQLKCPHSLFFPSCCLSPTMFCLISAHLSSTSLFSGVKSRIVTKATPSKEHATVSGIPITNFSESVGWGGDHIKKPLWGLTLLPCSGQCQDSYMALKSK